MEPESRARVPSLEHTELQPKSKDLKAQVVAGAEEDAEAVDHAMKGIMGSDVYQGLILAFALTA